MSLTIGTQKPSMASYTLILLRHGQSVWNRDNLFTGWTDVDLTDEGMADARQAGVQLAKSGYKFDICFTSVLKRAIKTMNLVLEEMDLLWVPTEKSWRLNERHYGALQGLNKNETAVKYGSKQVALWRRSWDVRPPPLVAGDLHLLARDPRYKNVPESLLPLSESLKDTVERVLPYWRSSIAPAIRRGKRVLIVAHGNSLRGLVKFLSAITDHEIPFFEIPTGSPLVYEFDRNLKTKRRHFLSN